MRIRARIVLLGLAAALVSLLSLTLLVLLPLSRDVTGDVRNLVTVGIDGQLTFAGVGVGTASAGPPSQDVGVAELGYRIPTYTSLAGDFGTKLVVLGDVQDQRVRMMMLVYEGNPLAITRLALRWREVFARASGECRLGWCWLRASDDAPWHARLSIDYAWYGPKIVTVSLEKP